MPALNPSLQMTHVVLTRKRCIGSDTTAVQFQLSNWLLTLLALFKITVHIMIECFSIMDMHFDREGLYQLEN
jgi:hypothetical protein